MHALTLPLFIAILSIAAAGNLAAQSDLSEPASADSTSSRADSTQQSQDIEETYRHALHINSGFGIAFNAPLRFSSMVEIRYNQFGVAIGQVESEEIPGIIAGVPAESAPVRHFRKTSYGVDLSYFIDQSTWLSFYGSAGYYWNDYLDLAPSSDSRSYQWVGRGTEKRVAIGAGAQVHIFPSFLNSRTSIMLGLGVHSYRGPVILFGYAERFNWPW